MPFDKKYKISVNIYKNGKYPSEILRISRFFYENIAQQSILLSVQLTKDSGDTSGAFRHAVDFVPFNPEIRMNL